MEDTKDLLRTLIGDLKALSVNLNSDPVRAGLQKALETEVDRPKKMEQYDIHLQVEGAVRTLDPNHTIILFRMLQEVLNNMVKHSAAAHIKIYMIASEFDLTLKVSDDGKGFDVQSAINAGGSGLLNLQQRARLIGAEISIQSTPEQGTQVTIKLPL